MKNWIYSEIKSEAFFPGEINIVFCSDAYLLEINKKYLNHNFYTDIITFNFNKDRIISGDLYISIERVTDNAKQFNIDFYTELRRVIIHGILHLLGFDDNSTELKIQIHKREDEALDRLNDNFL